MLRNVLRLAQDQRVVLVIAAIAIWRILSGSNMVFIYVLSFAYHFINLFAFTFRRYPFEKFLRHSLIARSIALGLLGLLMWPYLQAGLNLYGLIPLALGLVLHTAAVHSLGMKRTYYAVELGAMAPKRIRSFPYNVLSHPMELGAMLQFVGLYLICPAFSREYPLLIPGHLLLSGVTAFVEHYGLHVRDQFFSAVTGRFREGKQQQTIDSLRNWALDHYQSHLHRECSLHQYVKELPEEIIGQIDQLRFSDEVMNALQEAFPQGTVIPMSMTDEVYLSRYNYDGGGDQGLFDKHYDGNLRFMPGASMVRSLIYLSSADHLEVVFDTSDKRVNMNTYDFGLLDFHKELHWVEGSYDPQNPPRILLKCNYYIDHSGFAAYRRLGILLNLAVFYVVRAAMEYSKSPKTILQRQIGNACNFFRRLNNLNPAAPVAVTLTLLALSLKVVLLNLASWF